MRRTVFLPALGAALLVAGCGQKGPLYLPEKNPRVVTTPATQSQPAPAQSAPVEQAPAPPASPKPGDKSSDAETSK